MNGQVLCLTEMSTSTPSASTNTALDLTNMINCQCHNIKAAKQRKIVNTWPNDMKNNWS